jgi:hypothetical protein
MIVNHGTNNSSPASRWNGKGSGLLCGRPERRVSSGALVAEQDRSSLKHLSSTANSTTTTTRLLPISNHQHQCAASEFATVPSTAQPSPPTQATSTPPMSKRAAFQPPMPTTATPAQHRTTPAANTGFLSTPCGAPISLR